MSRRFTSLAAAFILLGLPGCGAALTAGAIFGVDLTRDDDDGPSDTPPAASVTTPAGSVNDIIEIRYRLTDPDPGDRAHVTVEYDAGAGYRPAAQAFTEGAEGTSNLTTSPGGEEHLFLWSSAADLGFEDVSGVRIRVTPRDTAEGGAVGQPVETAPFTCLNRSITSLTTPPLAPALNPTALAVGPDGDLVAADGPGHRVAEVDATTGATSLIAGTGARGYDQDGVPGVEAKLSFPASAAVDPASSDVVVADAFNGLLRRVQAASGFIDDVAGHGVDLADGVLANEALVFPRDVAVDRSGNAWFISHDRVRVVNLQGAVALELPLGTVGASSCGLSDPVRVGPGRVQSVYAACEGKTNAGAPSAFLAPPLRDAPALALHDDGLGTRILYVLDGGAGGADAQLFAVNFSDATVTFRTAAAPNTDVSVLPGDRTLLADSDALPDVGGFADLALVEPRVLLLTTDRSHGVFALNASPAPATVLDTRLDPGQLGRVAGTGEGGLAGDGGPPREARISSPLAVAATSDGALLVAEGIGRLRVLAPPGRSVTFGSQVIAAGTTGTLEAILPGTEPAVVQPGSVVVAPDGSLLVADQAVGDPRSGRLLRVAAEDAEVTSLVGSGVFGDTGDGGPASAARLGIPVAGATPDGELVLVSDFLHHRVRAVNTGSAPRTFLGTTIGPGEVATVVGTGAPADDVTGDVGDGGPATQASLTSPGTVAFDRRGLLWIGDTGAHRVRACNPTPSPVTVAGVTIDPGEVQTVVGTGAEGTPDDDGDGGPAASARLGFAAAFVGPRDDLWLVDGLDPFGQDTGHRSRVRFVNLSSSPRTVGGVAVAPGAIATVVGSGQPRSDPADTGDGGPALDATFLELGGVAPRADGLVFLPDPRDHRIRVANLATQTIELGGVSLAPGTIRTLVGTGLPGFAGDPGRAASGFFGSTAGDPIDQPQWVAATPDGRLFFADQGNGAVRMLDVDSGPRAFAGIEANPGEMVVVAGSRSGTVRSSFPVDLRVLQDGTVLFTETGQLGERPGVLALDPASRVVTRLAGGLARTESAGANLGDGGPALLATLADPQGLHLDDADNLYVADAGNQRIRFINRSGRDVAPVGTISVPPGAIETVVDGSRGDGTSAGDDGRGVREAGLDLIFPTAVSAAQGTLWVVDRGLQNLLRIDRGAGRVAGLLGGDVSLVPESSTGTVDGTTVLQDTINGDFVADGVLPGDLVVITAAIDLTVNGQLTTPPFGLSVVSVNGPTALDLDGKVDANGGTVSYRIDRRATPTAVAAIDDDRAYVAFRLPALGGTRLFEIARAGSAWTFGLVAGAAGAAEWNGDHLPARDMNLGEVTALFLDEDLLFVADRDNHRVVAVNVGGGAEMVAGLAIDPGEARTIAGGGQGTGGFNGDAVPPPLALLNQPTGVATGAGGVYLADQANGRLRRFQR